MVARGFALDDGSPAACIQASKQHRRFDLRRSDGRAVEDRRRIERAAQRDRAASALRFLDHLRAHQQQRIEHAPHRPLAQRRIAVEGRDESVAADHPHHQPRAGARVAEVERPAWLEQRTHAEAVDPPPPLAAALDAGAERAAGLSRAQHVVAFEHAIDRRFAAAQQAEDEGAMGDRLIAGRTRAASERAAALGGERLDAGRGGR